MTDVVEKVERLQGALATFAPVLCPVVTPKQFARFRTNPVKWCAADTHRDAVAGVVEAEYEAHKMKSQSPSDSSAADDDVQLVLLAQLDVSKMTWRIKEAKWCAPVEETLHSLEDFLVYACCAEDSSDDVRRHAKHFLKTNGHSADDTFVMQQCYSTAYALKVLLGNFGALRACVGASAASTLPLPLPVSASVEEVEIMLRGLFAAGRGECRGSKSSKKKKAKCGGKASKKRKSGSVGSNRVEKLKKPKRKLRAESYDENSR